MTVGNRIHEILGEKGLRQKDLATYIGTSPSTVFGWKEPNRNPSSDLIMSICEFLNVSPRYLLTGSDTIEDTPESSIRAINDLESDLLTYFRALPEDRQLRLVGYVEGLVDQYKSSQSKKRA